MNSVNFFLRIFRIFVQFWIWRHSVNESQNPRKNGVCERIRSFVPCADSQLDRRGHEHAGEHGRSVAGWRMVVAQRIARLTPQRVDCGHHLRRQPEGDARAVDGQQRFHLADHVIRSHFLHRRAGQRDGHDGHDRRPQVPQRHDALSGFAVGRRSASALSVRPARDVAVFCHPLGRGGNHLQADQVRRSPVRHGIRPQSHGRFTRKVTTKSHNGTGGTLLSDGCPTRIPRGKPFRSDARNADIDTFEQV